MERGEEVQARMRDGSARSSTGRTTSSASASPPETQGQDAGLAALQADLARRLAAARPRLIRLARAHGVTRDAADDAVQETLLVAWQQVARLRSPERFDAWLDGICRHVSQHHVRREHVRAHRIVRLAPSQMGHLMGHFAASAADAGALDPSPIDVPDPAVFDPSEELHRQDLQVLLDRALGYLSPAARTLVELCYLEGRPQREVAERMNLTLGALELRLHRTRRELRHLLGTCLSAEAEALGVVLNADLAGGWRETREWCNFCGRRRLQGLFEVGREGHINMRLRCPDCSARFGGDVYSTGGMVPLGGTHSFRPAFKRLIRFLKQRFAQDYGPGLQRGWEACPSCHRVVPMQLVSPHHGLAAFPSQWCLVFTCPTCGRIATPAAFAAYWTQPQVTPVAYQFIEVHPRWVLEPDAPTTYAGQSAIRFRLTDVAGGAQLTIFSHAHTLQILALVQQH